MKGKLMKLQSILIPIVGEKHIFEKPIQLGVWEDVRCE